MGNSPGGSLNWTAAGSSQAPAQAAQSAQAPQAPGGSLNWAAASAPPPEPTQITPPPEEKSFYQKYIQPIPDQFMNDAKRVKDAVLANEGPGWLPWDIAEKL